MVLKIIHYIRQQGVSPNMILFYIYTQLLELYRIYFISARF